MPEIKYDERLYQNDYQRGMAYSSDDSDRYRRTVVRRYKVGSSGDRVKRIEKIERVERSDDYRPARRLSDNVLDVSLERQDYVSEPPQSAFVLSAIQRTERDDNSGRIVYKRTKEVDRIDRERVRREVRGQYDDDIVVTSEGYNDHRDDNYGNVERWHREIEYYEPAAQQLQSVASPLTALRQQPGALAIREKERDRGRDWNLATKNSRFEDGNFTERHEEVTMMDRYTTHNSRDEGDKDRTRHQHSHHRHRGRSSYNEYDSDDSYYVKKTTVIRPEVVPDSHRRLHLAEGALAGAGLGALLSSRRNQKTGELPDHRGRQVLAGAALGALGTEILKRANSVYQDRSIENDDFLDDRTRSRLKNGENERRSSSRHTSKLKTGLGLAAAALAVAGAAKYIQSSRIDNEERNRGRSLRRYSDGEDLRGRSNSRSRPRSRAASVAKVAAGTAAVAGIVHHLRAKSHKRDGKSAQSHSRVRTGAEITGAALAGAAAKKLYDTYRDKKKAVNDQKEDYSSGEFSDDSRYGFSRPHNRSRSAPSLSPPPQPVTSHNHYSPMGADPELGLVEYGDQPLYGEPPVTDRAADRAVTSRRNSYSGTSYTSDRENRPRRRRHRPSDDYHSDESESIADDGNNEHYRNRSQLRHLAVAGASAAAAAIGIKTKGSKKRNNADTKTFRLDRHQRKDLDGHQSRNRYNQGHDRSNEYGRDDGLGNRRHKCELLLF
ncbi:hypothetical protein SEPCBS57363_006688 [Sporothrix epigloea]|uniref:DUF3824 domain-containing protein n=1 Tax=Sporothrix epigloea TaxID=1892477 RepID=A0ABP0E4W2_9PEZI